VENILMFLWKEVKKVNDNRWKMNRIGFVNFWLYDDEIFEFADGKLLIRGQNASGKSITTQSFIPFILDGDRTPSRLDPFGSNDRKMEYYLLGEGEKEESIAYLFLEFKKKNSEQFRTIGIGQRAQKGKAMDFWGFIIIDGRRIGHDIFLYKKAGNKKIPCTKQELKNIIGNTSVFSEAQRDYMANVNKYIFGFPKVEQYAQFIKILVKVRAPKLSNEFKPAKVYEILNSSLQTLSDDDLRAMADAMEKMDDIQVKLDNLKYAFRDLQNIRNEYVRYNKYIIYQKAYAYIHEKKNADKLRSKFERDKADLKSKKCEIVSCTDENICLSNERAVLIRERNSLDISDIDNLTEKLSVYKEEKANAEKEKERFSYKIENRQKKIFSYDSQIRQYKIEIDSYDKETSTIFHGLDIDDEIIKFEFHSQIKNLINSNNIMENYRRIDTEIKNFQNNVEKGREAICRFNEIEEKWDFASLELDKLKIIKQSAEEQLSEAEAMDNRVRDEIIEKYYENANNYKELIITNDVLDKVLVLIQKYQGNKDFGEINLIFRKLYENKRDSLNYEKALNTNRKDAFINELEKLKEELNTIINMKSPEPERKNSVLRARNILEEKNIKFIPFYEAFEFAENINREKQDLLESQFCASGLLDALIISEEDMPEAKKLLKGLSDTLINVPEDNNDFGFNYLISGDMDLSLKRAADNVLKNISMDYSSGAVFVISDDGYFRNGIIEGYAFSDERASYIGPMARKYKKEMLMAEKQKEIDSVDEKINVVECDIQKTDARIFCLEDEYKSLPSFVDLDTAIDILSNAENNLKNCIDDYNKKENEVIELEKQKKNCNYSLIKICQNLPYIRKAAIYEEVSEAIDSYRDNMSSLYSCILERKRVIEKLEDIKVKIEDEEFEKDEDFRSLQREENNIKKFNIEINSIEEYLNNNEIKEKSKRLRELNDIINIKSNKIIDNDKKIAVLKDNIDRLSSSVEEIEKLVVISTELETKLKKYFEEELSLELVLKKNKNSIYDSALDALGLLNENEQNKSVSDMVGNLIKTYQKYSGSLVAYGTSLENCFEDDSEDSSILRKRYRIVSLWQGKKCFLEQFYAIIKQSIESTELIIQESDRKLFEDILADTLSRKLNNRIMESRRWIKEMSELMRKIDTSMALTFSMEWKPKPAEGEGEIGTIELEKILSRDKELLTREDIDKVSTYFRKRINIEKQSAQEKGDIVNYSDLIRNALDYRDWFEFKIYYYRNGEAKKELTNSAFNKFSGGEKAMAIYVPLFAAINAQYKKAENVGYPRIIALDEAFAGVDDKNISSMFELVERLDFDYIMNSQVLWGCFKTVKSLKIIELQRAKNSSVVTAINFRWNGIERICEL